ncbi:MAG: type II toxin-antitoxin system RelE/ParE family toxin [Thermodesulfatator sp.]|nr:MAG: type II toxin-antitoxin system RelE/ParE family toxin [Thermodesulfatator sp.]
MPKIKILNSAREDLWKGYHFYEAQRAGLGEYFLHSLFSDIDSLLFYAGIHPKKFGFYRILSRRFPYAIYYKIEKDTIFVYAILDCRQDPRKIERRLQKK